MKNMINLVIGTRGSPLALAQARMTAAELARVNNTPISAFPLEIITTLGDATQDRALSEIGGKGLFTKEIDLAQLDGRIDLAVHSAKDLPTVLPEGLVIAGYLPREDVRDALIAPRHGTVEALPQAARIGTVSLRRQAMLRRIRPDFAPEILRGNVETRLKKAESGEFDAVILAMAGLNRLGLSHQVTQILDASRFIPAVGQGAIALVAREDDVRVRALVGGIAHPPTMAEVSAERAFLHVLDGSCRTPIGGNARYEAGRLTFRGIVLTPDGQIAQEVAGEERAEAAITLGRLMGEKARASAAFDVIKRP